MDLIGTPHDVVGHCLRLPDVGDGTHDVTKGSQVLHVDGGEDVDAGVEQFLDVLPALCVAASGDVRVGVFVDDGDARLACQDRVDVHLFKAGVPVRNRVRRDDFQSVHQGTGVAAPMVHGEGHHHVFTAAAQPVSLLKHGVGLPYSRGCPEENAQRCPCHVVILSLV
ncbi:hypothetical protein AHiyo1_26530 [Arthrobacter sp. Hiyo1]|nr:hypothetical protein AHiyo1_26530 [Arthrobacter sp. Hiyo1]